MTGVITPPTPTVGEAVPIITVLAVFVAMFLSVRHRAGAERVRLWAYGWALVFLHFMLRLLGARAGSLVRFVVAGDYATLELAALVFIASFLFRSDDSKKRRVLVALAGVPIVVHSLAMFGLEGAVWLRAAAFALVFLGPAAFWWKTSEKRSWLQGVGICTLIGIGLLGAWQLLHGDRNLRLGIMLTSAYGLCG